MIHNRETLARTDAHETALACIEAGVRAALPRHVVGDSVERREGTLLVSGTRYDLDAHEEVLLLGGGKAAGQVAAALESILGERLARGVVVTDDPVTCDRVDVLEADHPVPGERGVEAAGRVADLAAAADEGTLVLAVVTGGGSALLPAPADGVDLGDLRAVTRSLVESGAPIGEVNAVRKHLSALKGGGLARAAAPATVVSLLFSDVVGDDPAVVASGPAAPDPTTYGDALSVLDRYAIDAPPAVRERLERGAAGEHPETPTADDPVFDRVDTHVLATGRTALSAAREAARERGYRPLVLSSRVEGEARDAAGFHRAVVEECLASGEPVEPPAVVLSGGETTVAVRGDGRGGPNLEFALTFGLDCPAGVVCASVDTDGRDGGTDAAGALVDAGTVADREAARDALADNDAYPFLADRDALVFTGPTGTNVNDLRAFVVESLEAGGDDAE